MKRAELLRALEIVRPGLTHSSEMVKDDRVFMFDAGHVVAYNDALFVQHPVEGLDFSGAIQAEEFYKLLSKLSGDDVEIKNDGAEIRLSSGRVKAGFTVQQEAKPISDEVREHGKWKSVPAEFGEALAFTMATCATGMARPDLACINVKSGGRLESSDNYRVSVYDLESETGVKTFLLPSASAQVAAKHKLIKVAEGGSWIHFKTDEGTKLGCRIFEDEYPQLDKLLDVSGVEIELPATITDVLDRAVSFCAQEDLLDQKATMAISGKLIKIRVEIKNAWFEEEKRMGYDGQPITCVINPMMLKFIMMQTRTCVIGKSCLKFTGKNWQHVVALVEEE